MGATETEIAAKKAELTAAKEKLKSLKGELDLYREDFEILETAQDSLAQLTAIIDYNDQVLKALSNSNESIITTCNKYNVPGLKELMDEFDSTMYSSLSSLSSSNGNCTSDFDEAGQKIDQAKAKVAEEIEKLKIDVDACEIRIASLVAIINYM